MNLEQLRAEWHRASEKDRPQDAIKALVQLEKLEPHEARWSQRLGEAYRRTGHTKEAVEAFVRAFERFFERGFLPRAIAMAKLVGSFDAARGDLLERSLPKTGRALPPPLPSALAEPPKLVVKPPPLPSGTAPKPARVGPPPLPKVARPAPMERAEDTAVDEVRFVDAPDASVEIMLVDFDPSQTVRIEDDDGPDTVQHALPTDEKPPPYDAYSAMASFRLFASLSREALLALAEATELVEFVPGALLIVRDERAFALYAIVSGSAKVIVPGSPEIHLGEGDVFGEASLLDEGTRQADVRAETPLMTLRVQKQALDDVTKAYPEVEDALFDLLARRLITNLMHSSPLFAPFESSVKLELGQKFEVRRAAAGTVIAERGRRSDGLYILLAGNVMAEPEGGPAIRIARGTAFGHASLMGRTAKETVRAASEAVLLRMPAAGFSSLVALYPPALAHLAETADDPLPTSRRL
jgi:CRP-like cAMP-binding protein